MTCQVREYALLTSDQSHSPSMDVGVVSAQTFAWLEMLQGQWGGGAQILNREGKRFLRLGSYVGYLQAPNGESIEILPKTQLETTERPEPLRQLLRRMLTASVGMTPREASQAALQRHDQPLHEWIFSEFLRHLMELMRKGLRFDYHPIEDDESAFIRGQLDINRQLRNPPGRETRFNVRYAEFSPQRIENRLLRSVLDVVLKLTKENNNWRQANALRHRMAEIMPFGGNALAYISQWSEGKYLYAYRAIKPWCQLILEKLNPDFQKGIHQGISLLFPMERLYESWVGHHFSLLLRPDFMLTTQAKRHHLLEHIPLGSRVAESWFMLKPDFLITKSRHQLVLDAKWKLLDTRHSDRKRKYEISQADLYQMFAYGQKYLHGQGDMMLIYPRHQFFNMPLPVFRFDKHLALWCVPFDLERGLLVGGEWQSYFDCFNALEENISSAENISFSFQYGDMS
ncbi:McrC family protein [Pectobacterium aroidearum]|uniref:McrC family protein n=1 Tax=Pectobacterium aroidearum TaxID=1201031 RepID=UPI00211390DA|nr:McrC family protein [Pectobacterium aroidearum]UUE58113.1 McrC family protein [Pectobacterium aroidearum]UUE70819.1 McrC family protein [Pectobacterium aroidearum]UUE75195.1 McrC family protein [Pectobacterium aroidearum]UUE79526.1 McrC family protein [Pectobacterium aroidearum]